MREQGADEVDGHYAYSDSIDEAEKYFLWRIDFYIAVHYYLRQYVIGLHPDIVAYLPDDRIQETGCVQPGFPQLCRRYR